jgi:hypothetical protein
LDTTFESIFLVGKLPIIAQVSIVFLLFLDAILLNRYSAGGGWV